MKEKKISALSAVSESFRHRGRIENIWITFCIITSAEMTAKEALDLYKSRDASEKLFKADKVSGEPNPQVYTGESLEGENADHLCCPDHREPGRRKAEGCREEEMRKRPNYMNVPASIRELEKIREMVNEQTVYTGWIMPLPLQKTILKAFGIDANYVKRKSKRSVISWIRKF